MTKRFTKSLLVIGTVATVGLGSLGAASIVNAQSTTKSTTDSARSSIIDKLAAKFGVDKSEVQAVFDEEHAARAAERLTKLTDKLASYVSDGSITQEQSDKILAKYKEIQMTRDAAKDSLDSLTKDERKAKMDEQRTAFDEWVKSSGIPEQYAKLALGFGRGHGPGGHHGPHGDKPHDSHEDNAELPDASAN